MKNLGEKYYLTEKLYTSIVPIWNIINILNTNFDIFLALYRDLSLFGSLSVCVTTFSSHLVITRYRIVSAHYHMITERVLEKNDYSEQTNGDF